MKKNNRKNKRVGLIFLLLGVILIVWGMNFLLNDNEGAITEAEPIENDNPNQLDNEDDNPLEANEEENLKSNIQTLKISAVGDIMFHMSQINGAYDDSSDSYDFKPFFEEIKPFIEKADIAIGNFEGTTAGLENGNVYKAWPVFNVPDETLEALKYAGFDILSTINNHSIDMGKQGIIRTIDQIKEKDMLHIGTRKTKEENRVMFLEENHINLAILAYTYGCNGLEQYLTPEELDYMVNIIDEEKIREDINLSKENNADVIIAIMHWGNEFHREPSITQRNLADMMLSEGVDIILGSHPHVIQDSKTLDYNGEKKFVVYSMGNFISNQRYETLVNEYPNFNMYYTEDGVVINIELEKNIEEKTTIIKDINFIPTWVNREKKDGKYDYDILPIKDYLDKNQVTEEMKKRMENSYNNTMIKMNSNLN